MVQCLRNFDSPFDAAVDPTRRGILERLALLCAALLLAAPRIPCQTPATASQLEAMRKLDLWVGDWTGSGWSMSASGKRTEFSLTETVRRTVGGTVLLVEGHGTTTASTGQETVTHDGVALISYDAKSGRYHWSGHDLASGATNTEPVLVDGGLTWSIKADERGTVVRFTIRFDATYWRETGEVTADGKNWNTFMEMKLARR